MRDPAAWARWLVPHAQRARVFDPAVEDAQRERRVRRRRARGALPRTGVQLLFLWRTLAAALESRALGAESRGSSEGSQARLPMIGQDLRFALRMLRKAPGFTLAAVCAIALGIGANTAIFTVIKQVLLQPLPYPQPDRIVDVNEYSRGRVTAVSPPNFLDWRAGNRTLASLSAYNEQVVTLAGGGAEPSRISAALVDAALGDVTGVTPVAGRAFTDADLQPGARQVVILSHGLWQRAFGGDRAVVSRQIELEGEAYEVIGVMPRGFDFPDGSEAWLPLRLTPHDVNDNQRGAHYLSAVGRLKDGVSAAQATADLDAIEQRIAARFPSRVGGYSTGAVPLLASMVDQVRRPLYILFAAVAFVLLIACVNVANLLLARATTRTGEIALRAALGAGRGRLMRQLIAESVVLALAGGAAGILLASWAVRALMSVAPPDLPRAADVRIDAAVLAFSVALSVLAGVVFGTVPALLASRPNLAVFLRDIGRDAGASGGRRRLRAVLVMAQVALALVLLAAAGLTLRSFDRLTHVDPGFRTANVLTFNISLPDAPYPSMETQTGFFREFTARLAAVPGVAAAGAVSLAPVTPEGFGGTFTVFGRPPGQDEGNAQIRSITPGYLQALSIPLVAGRGLTDQDGAGAARVALVSESTARKYWPGESPVGKQLRLHVNEPTKMPREIVGVVADVRTRGMDVEPVPVVYVPHAQYGPESMAVMVRGAGDPRQLVPQVTATLRGLASSVAMGRTRPMDDLVSASVAQPRFRALLLTIFAAVALVLAALGLYGVVAFSVNQRRPELGVRMALGADRREVLRLVLREGMTPVAIGILIGLGGAAAAGRVLATLLFGVEPFDPLTFTVVALTLAVVGFAACYLPARRATQVDPAASLR